MASDAVAPIQSVGALDLIGNARRRIAQHQAGEAAGMGRAKKQADDPARGFADQCHPRSDNPSSTAGSAPPIVSGV